MVDSYEITDTVRALIDLYVLADDDIIVKGVKEALVRIEII